MDKVEDILNKLDVNGNAINTSNANVNKLNEEVSNIRDHFKYYQNRLSDKFTRRYMYKGEVTDIETKVSVLQSKYDAFSEDINVLKGELDILHKLRDKLLFQLYKHASTSETVVEDIANYMNAVLDEDFDKEVNKLKEKRDELKEKNNTLWAKLPTNVTLKNVKDSLTNNTSMCTHEYMLVNLTHVLKHKLTGRVDLIKCIKRFI